jgi:hypothetical protein
MHAGLTAGSKPALVSFGLDGIKPASSQLGFPATLTHTLSQLGNMSLFAIKAIAVADREITVEWGVKRVECMAADMW